MRLTEPLRRRDFAVLWAGQATSMAGDGIFTVAIAFQVLALRNDPATLSLVLLAGTVGLIVFLLAGGVVSDRLERRRVLIGSDAVRALAVAALGVLSSAGALQLWHVVALLLVYGAGEAFFQPAFGAFVPAVVPADELVQANALAHIVRPLAFRFAGPALGGVLVAAAGPGPALLADAGTFVVSIGCLAALRVRSHAETVPDRALREVREGWRYVRSQPWLWATLGAAAVSLLCFYGPTEVLVPYVVRNDLGGGAGAYGAVLAAWGAGSIAGSLLVAHRGMPRRTVAAMYLCWTTGGLPIAGYGLASAVWQLMVLGAAGGAFFAAGMVMWATLMQTRVPPHMLGRVTSLDFLVSVALTPLSFALVAPVAAGLGASATLVLAGASSALATLAFLPAASRAAATPPPWPGPR